MIYSSILFLQVFTVGGVLVNDNRTHRTFLVWTTALHLGALVCFFWTLVITALVRKVLFSFLFSSDVKIKRGDGLVMGCCGRGWLWRGDDKGARVGEV